MGVPIEDGSISSENFCLPDNLHVLNSYEKTVNLNEEDETKPPQDRYLETKDFRIRALDLVHKLSNEIYGSYLSGTLMQEVCEIITSSFPITFASIERYDDQNNVIFSALSIDQNLELIPEPRALLKLEDTLSGEVIRRNSTLIFSNRNKDEMNICPSMCQPMRIKHYIGIPIISSGKTIGVFSIASIRNITIDKETITWAETIAHHLCSIYAREEILKKVNNNEKIAYQMLEAISAPTIMCDNSGNILFANDRFKMSVNKYLKGKSRGKTIHNILHRFKEIDISGVNERLFYEMFTELTIGNKTQVSFDILIARGSNRKWFLVNLSKVSNQEAVIIMFYDITKTKHIEEKLEHEILHDPTSGLANRVLFHENLNIALEYSFEKQIPICIFSIDVGRYGFIVESLGHDAADEVMCDAAKRIKLNTNVDDLVARVGSSEFAILFKNINNPNQAQIMAKELVDTLNAPFDISHQDILLKPSIGITVTNISKYLNADIVLHDAHSAMTLCRDTAKQSYAFASLKGSAFAIKKLKREKELSKAILNSQINPFYQTEIDLNSDRIIGAESLARWHHPHHGILAPKHFIDLAEETNLIGPLFESMFTQVLKDLITLYDNGHNITIWTNISANQFQTHNIAEIISGLIKSLDAPIDLIGIEITETALMKDLKSASVEFTELKKLGIQIALDDFGTGYSSLSHLAQFPVDLLKIDQSFVANMITNKSSAEIVSAVIGLAHGMQIKTLAEGIETISQLEILRDIGCDFGQGYYYKRPIDFISFQNHIENKINN
ncbi:MAG: EAL domain-containing protein [Acidimicrobiia bacterium]|nr:EAL domain-containing protein [Acidimicrobiia bacterium]